MKTFTDADVQPHGAIPHAGKLFADTTELVLSELPWQKLGLQQSASGYGAKLTSSYKISFNGKLRRLYVTQYGNAGSSWFVVKGKKIFVS